MMKRIISALVVSILFFSQTLFAGDQIELVGKAIILIDIADVEFYDATYNGNVQGPMLVYGDKVLEEGKDYTITWLDNSGGCKNAGRCKVTVTGIGDFTNSVDIEYIIHSKVVSPEIILFTDSHPYTGQKITPLIKEVTDGTRSYKSSECKITNLGGKDVGFYYVEVKLIGNYSGEAYTIFQITPKIPKIKKLKGEKKKLTVVWKKEKIKKKKNRPTGFQIEVSKDILFDSIARSVKVKGSNKTKKVIKKLKSKVRYYVRMRSYKTIKGQTIYSSWSKTKKVKVK